jgi:hypothetical protein
MSRASPHNRVQIKERGENILIRGEKPLLLLKVSRVSILYY